MKKVLFVSEHFPSKVGGVRGLYYDLCAFSKKFEVHFIRLKLSKTKTLAILELPKNVKFLEVECKGLSFSPSFFLYPIYFISLSKMAWARPIVQDYINKNNIDCVILNTNSCSVALHDIKSRSKVAEIIDSVNLYYKTKYEKLRTTVALMTYWLNRLLSKILFWQLSKNFDLFVYISKADRNEEYTPKNKTIIYLQARDPPLKKIPNNKRDIDVVIFGAWNHPPNRDGIKEIISKLGEIKGNIVIVGPHFYQKQAFPSNVKYVGFVEDISNILLRSKIALIPVYYGAGVQNKVFDALRHGCVVVTTKFTKNSFEANGLKSESISCSDDLIAGVNLALKNYTPCSVKKACQSYRKFYFKSWQKEYEFVKKVLQLIKQKAQC